MVHTFHPYFDPAQAAAFNEVAIEKDSTFEFRYFALHGYGAATRVILAANGAKFSNVVPADWAAEKPHTPFGVMPLLKEISADGKVTINIAESDAIERYLAEKFGMAGDNAFERTVVNSYVNNSNDLMHHIYMKFFTVKDPAVKAEAKEQLLSGLIATWIKHNEKHLVANGSNGHYIGNKTTIADIKTAHMVEIIKGVKEDAITEESAPALLKVKTTVDLNPSLKAWRATDEFKTFSERNFSVFGFA
ncbi:Glutathione S-transferase S1 [Mortierella sp. AD094]|nr:Glutathione S-transferase S1 [Mortierella sp. AD094]